MGEKTKIVKVIELRGEAQGLQGTLTALKKGFDGLAMPGELAKSFDKLENALGTILRKTEKGIISREDFQEVEKEITKVKNGFDSLSGVIESIQKSGDKKLLSLIPKGTIDKITAAKQAYDAYSRTVSTVIKAEQELEKATKKKEETSSAAESATRSASAYKGKVTTAKKELEKYREITEALEEQRRAAEELENATKELEKAQRSGMGEKALKTRRARVDNATTAKGAADAKVEGFTKKQLEEQAAATEKVRIATEKYDAAMRAAEEAEKAKTEAEVQAQRAKTSLQQAQTRSAEQIEEEKKALESLKAALSAIDPKFKDLTLEGKTTTEQLANLKTIIGGLSEAELNKLKVKLGQTGEAFEQAKTGVEGLKGELGKVKEATKQSDEALSQQKAFEDKIKSFLGLSGAAQVLRASLRDAMQTITELDKTMTEMAVVTDLGVSDYWDQLPQYTKRANELGLAINDVYKADTLFYQQGLKTNEVVAISTETMKMARIAGIDTALATDRMTAALRGFNMELNETSAQKIADVYSELAAITAADVKEISAAMTKTASIASSAGMEFETTAAFLSQIIETTRESAETAGTAMKTVIARFQELKKAPDEIGEVDGEIVDANAIETALRSVGVALRDSSGQFRELDDVFLELSSKWSGLDKNTQRYIATIAAGSRQQSRFIAMMSDYERTQQLVASANNSAGASNKQFEKTAESLWFKINQLKNAWHEFTMGIMESEFVKIGVDILAKFLEIINKASGGIDGLGGSLMKIIGIFSIFKMGMKIFNKIETPIMQLFKKVTEWAGIEGFKSGKAYAESAEKGAQSVISGDSKKERHEDGENKDPRKKRKENLQAGIMYQVTGKKEKEKKPPKETAKGLGTSAADLITDGAFSKAKEANEKLHTAKGKATEAAKTIQTTKTKTSENSARIAELDTVIARYDEREKELLANRKQRLGIIESYNARLQAGYDLTEGQVDLLQQLEDEEQELTDIRSKGEDALAEQLKLQEENEAAVQTLANAEEEFSKQTDEMLNAQDEKWKNIGDSIAAAGEKVMGLGIGISALGGLLSSLGIKELEGLGESLTTIGTIITFIGTALTAIPPILTVISSHPIVAIVVAALALIITGLKHAAKAWNDNSPEGKLKAAQKATEEAKKAAQEAKEAYDQLLSNRSEYSDLQDSLKNLTKGTIEWKEALLQANAQVLEMAQNYPELNKYISRGENGQLIISEAGWDYIQEDQKKKYSNSQIHLASDQYSESLTRMQNLEDTLLDLYVHRIEYVDYTTSTVMGTGLETNVMNMSGTVAPAKEIDGFEYTGNYIYDEQLTDQLNEQLEEIYLINGDSVRFNQQLAQELMDTYGLSMGQLEAVGERWESVAGEMRQISEEMFYAARTNLSFLASDFVQNSKYGSNVIDTFTKSQLSDTYQNNIKTAAGSYDDGGDWGKIKNDEDFLALWDEYRLSRSDLTDNDAENLGKLYKEMAGVSEIPSDLQGNEEKLREAIAEMATYNEHLDNMDTYTSKLEGLGGQDARNISSIFSENGKDMTIDFAKSFFKDENGGDRNSREYIDTMAEKLGYTTEEWAKLMGKSVDELYKEAEDNAKKTIAANEQAFEKLNRILGTTDGKIEKFGTSTSLTLEQTTGLINKMVSLTNLSTTQQVQSVKQALDSALDSAGDGADELASYLETMNWQDESEWEKLPEMLKSMGIAWRTEIANFVTQAKNAAHAIKIVDFANLNKELQDIYNTISEFKSGEQGREIEKEVYESIIASNKNLASQFVQLGDKFIYIGSNMSELTGALAKNSLAILNDAKNQLAAKQEMSTVIGKMETITYGSNNLSINDEYKDWNDEQLLTFLEAYKNKAIEIVSAEGGTNDANALNYLDTEGIGLSFTTDFSKMTKEQKIQAMDMIKKNYLEAGQLNEEFARVIETSIVAEYALVNDGTTNAKKAQEMRDQGNTQEAERYSKALLAQAAQSGVVSEQIMSKYSELIADGVTESEAAEVQRLESSMSAALDTIIENQEKNDALISVQNRVAEAIYESRQKEIDKLSELNESVQSANSALIGKLQEQISEQRQYRQNEEAKQGITDMRSQMAYMAMDTSGGNALSITGLEEQIAKAEQNYQDSLIDQALQELSDANEKAAEQRERQIDLMQSQLDYAKTSGKLMQEAQQITNQALADVNAGAMFKNTKAGQLITTAENWQEKAPEEYNRDMLDLQQEAITAAQVPTSVDVDDMSGDVTGRNGGKPTSIETIADILTAQEEKETTRNNAVSNVSGGTSAGSLDVSKFSTRNGFSGIKASANYKEQEAAYIGAGGTSTEFEQRVRDQINAQGGIKTGSIDNVGVKVGGGNNSNNTKADKAGQWYTDSQTTDKVEVTIGKEKYSAEFRNPGNGYNNGALTESYNTEGKTALRQILGEDPRDTWIAAWNGEIYMYRSATDSWNQLKGSQEFKQAYLSKLNAFETGGLADFTGPAWLDGTKSRPEYVLNAKQTERFFSLVDVLEGYDSDSKNNKSSGDNYFEIEINVEKLENDYDVEQVANKIRRMIYDDATYRNVNAINHIR